LGTRTASANLTLLSKSIWEISNIRKSEKRSDTIKSEIQRPLRQRTIGILGGCSNVATGEYYKFLNSAVNNTLGGWEIAETLIAGMNFGNIEAFVRAEDWMGLSSYMDSKVQGLAAGGADLLICVSNTLHRYLEPIAEKHGLPFIHIADPTGKAIAKKSLKRIALFGTKPVMETEYLNHHYRDNFCLNIIVPNANERDDIDRIIFDELVKFEVSEAPRQRYLEIADRLVAEEGAEGLILGCTEIFLLLRQEDKITLPMFNTTQLHCEAAVEFALRTDVQS
jgi:aspartate racemase